MPGEGEGTYERLAYGRRIDRTRLRLRREARSPPRSVQERRPSSGPPPSRHLAVPWPSSPWLRPSRSARVPVRHCDRCDKGKISNEVRRWLRIHQAARTASRQALHGYSCVGVLCRSSGSVRARSSLSPPSPPCQPPPLGATVQAHVAEMAPLLPAAELDMGTVAGSGKTCVDPPMPSARPPFLGTRDRLTHTDPP
jgi:hypothetical protein